MNDNGLSALAQAAGADLGLATGLGFVIFPVVDALKRYLGKFGSDVMRLAFLVALAFSLLVTFAKIGTGTITGGAILAGIVRGIVTAFIAIALGQTRQAVPDNRPAFTEEEPERISELPRADPAQTTQRIPADPRSAVRGPD